MAKILIIDDDPGIVQVISDLCSRAGHSSTAFNSGRLALDSFAQNTAGPDLVLTDLRMEGVDGMDVLRELKHLRPGTPVILVTANKSAEAAVQAMQEGASDYILKPFRVDAFLNSIQRSLSPTPNDARNPARPHLLKAPSFANMVGTSQRMRQMFALVNKIADSDSTILITGESGTGKELIARALHDKSQRSNRSFVAINCSALPQNLLESELFGHKKGAFTGAFQDKVGLFEEAEGGTVFLDEINSMAPLLQTKLLRVLQERVIRRVGDNHSIPIHVRVLAATNEPLQEKIKSGEFRQDLYYRLAVIPVEVPPLRERAEDIRLLAEHFLAKHARPDSSQVPLAIETTAMHALCTYAWPGNVRELENAIERACVLCENGVVRIHDLPPQVVEPPSSPTPSALQLGVTDEDTFRKLNSVELPLGLSLHDFVSALERRFIEQTIRLNQGSRERAAQMLGISSATLYRKMELDRKSPAKV